MKIDELWVSMTLVVMGLVDFVYSYTLTVATKAQTWRVKLGKVEAL